MRFFLGAVVVAVALIPASRLRAAVGDAIISEPAAERHGLTRPWLAQVEMDRACARVSDMALYEGTLYVQTNRANISAFDAETGRQLWSKNIGRPDFPSLPLAVEGDLLGHGQRVAALRLQSLQRRGVVRDQGRRLALRLSRPERPLRLRPHRRRKHLGLSPGAAGRAGRGIGGEQAEGHERGREGGRRNRPPRGAAAPPGSHPAGRLPVQRAGRRPAAGDQARPRRGTWSPGPRNEAF